MPLPLDLRVALAPLDTYRELIAEPARGSWLRALERPALVAVIVGTVDHTVVGGPRAHSAWC